MLQFAPATTTEQEAGLPALIDRATRALAGARTSAEVLEARELAGFAYDAAKRAERIAKLEAAHDEVIAAVHRAQGHALELKAQASKRYYEETQAAIARGEIPGRGGDRRSEDFKLADEKFENPTAHHQATHEGKAIAQAEAASPGITKRAIDAMVARRKSPTQAGIKQQIAPYVASRGSADMAKAEAAADEREFRKFKKTWKAMRPGARELCLAWLKA